MPCWIVELVDAQHLMLSIFRLRRITFLQAVGLLSLCRILLGPGFFGVGQAPAAKHQRALG